MAIHRLSGFGKSCNITRAGAMIVLHPPGPLSSNRRAAPQIVREHTGAVTHAYLKALGRRIGGNDSAL
jgi:hypothetical protein